jgi:DNA-binding MarR family transcriptional regulator
LEISEEAVTRVIEAWRERTSYLPSEILSDPAWGMLLELLQAEVQDRRVSLSRLCTVSRVSSSAAVRWLKALERQGLAVRRADPQDTDNEFVELSLKGRSALRRYFHDVVQSH